MVPRRSATSHTESLLDNCTHATLIDITHGEDFDSSPPNVFFFYGVDITNPHQHAVLGLHLGRKIENIS